MSAYNDKVDAVLFKHEDEDRGRIVGPVYVRRNGETKNYKDGSPSWDGGHFAAWFTLSDARKIAESLNLPLFEV